MHFNSAKTSSWCHDLIQRKPLLLPDFWSLLRSTMWPYFCFEGLRVCHITRMVRIWPKETVSTYALSWCSWDIGAARICKSRSALSCRKLVIFTNEAPFVILHLLMIWDEQKVWKGLRATLVIGVFPWFGSIEVHSPWSWFRLKSVHLNYFCALFRSTKWCFIRSWQPLTRIFTSWLLKLFL